MDKTIADNLEFFINFGKAMQILEEILNWEEHNYYPEYDERLREAQMELNSITDYVRESS